MNEVLDKDRSFATLETRVSEIEKRRASEQSAMHDRLKVAEAKLSEIEKRAPKSTSFYGFALFVVIAVYALIVFNIPGLGDFGDRFGPAAGAGVAAFAVFGVALGIVASILKSLIEAAAALLVLGNALGSFVAWHSRAALAVLASEMGAGPDVAPVIGLAIAALAILAADVLVLLVLYPMANAAGTRLHLD